MISSSAKPKTISITIGEENSTQSPKKLEQFLQFQLGTNISALFKAEIVKEIITISEAEILPVPSMPQAVIGIYNYRSEMLWIIDLENLLGYPSSFLHNSDLNYENQSLMTMFIDFEGQAFGLVVSNISGILERDLQEIHSPSPELFPETMLPFIQGYFTSQNQDMLILLKPDSICYEQVLS